MKIIVKWSWKTVNEFNGQHIKVQTSNPPIEGLPGGVVGTSIHGSLRPICSLRFDLAIHAGLRLPRLVTCGERRIVWLDWMQVLHCAMILHHMIWQARKSEYSSLEHVLYHRCTAADSTYHSESYTTSYPWARTFFMLVDSDPCHHCTCCFLSCVFPKNQHSAVDFIWANARMHSFCEQLNCFTFIEFSAFLKCKNHPPKKKEKPVSCRVHFSILQDVQEQRFIASLLGQFGSWHYGSDELCSPSPIGHKRILWPKMKWRNMMQTLTQHSTSHEIMKSHLVSSCNFETATTWSNFSNPCVCCRCFLFEKSTQSTLMEP